MPGGSFLVLVAVAPIDSTPASCSFSSTGKIRLIEVIFGENSRANSAVLTFDLSSTAPCIPIDY